MVFLLNRFVAIEKCPKSMANNVYIIKNSLIWSTWLSFRGFGLYYFCNFFITIYNSSNYRAITSCTSKRFQLTTWTSWSRGIVQLKPRFSWESHHQSAEWAQLIPCHNESFLQKSQLSSSHSFPLWLICIYSQELYGLQLNSLVFVILLNSKLFMTLTWTKQLFWFFYRNNMRWKAFFSVFLSEYYRAVRKLQRLSWKKLILYHTCELIISHNIFILFFLFLLTKLS